MRLDITQQLNAYNDTVKQAKEGNKRYFDNIICYIPKLSCTIPYTLRILQSNSYFVYLS